MNCETCGAPATREVHDSSPSGQRRETHHFCRTHDRPADVLKELREAAASVQLLRDALAGLEQRQGISDARRRLKFLQIEAERLDMLLHQRQQAGELWWEGESCSSAG
jgi:hypothetical protein